MNSETEAGNLQVEKESEANTTGVPKSRIFSTTNQDSYYQVIAYAY